MTTDPYSLDLLEDIVVPEPVGLFPLASGWWYVIAITGSWAGYLLINRMIRYWKNAYRREGLKLIRALESAESYDEGMRQADEVLKRVAMVSFRRNQVAPLWGQSWVDFLESTSDSIRFDQEPAARFATINIQPLPDSFSRRDYLSALETAAAWVRHHSVEPK